MELESAEQTGVYLDGRWVRGKGVDLVVHAPWDAAVLATFTAASAEQVDEAVSGARDALARPVQAAERARVLDAVAELLSARREGLARIVALEAAKPLGDARAEVDRAAQTFRFSAAAARTLSGRAVGMDAHPAGAGLLAVTLREPIGVVAAITPFNFPLNLVAHKVGPGLAAGCPVVLKPAEQTPLSALALAGLFHEAGLAAGWLQVVTGEGRDGGWPLASHDDVAVVTFTGSPEVGWRLHDELPRKKVLLELGSAAPLIVERDADLDEVVPRVAKHAFAHAGQSCVSVQRIVVHHSRAQELTDALVEAVRALRVGDPLDERSDLSSLIDEGAGSRVRSALESAVDAGGRVLCGGEGAGAVVQPALVADVPLDDGLWRSEIFGPVAVVNPFADFSEAVASASLGGGGLNAGVFTQSLSTALRYAEALPYGAVLVNESPTFRVDQMPYGGEGASGNTREGPAWAVEELTVEKLLVLRA